MVFTKHSIIKRGRDRRLESGEEEKLLSSTDELKRLIILALETGMRRGEILNIKKSHINFARQTLLIPLTKTDTPRTIPLSSRAITVLGQIPTTCRIGSKTGRPAVYPVPTRHTLAKPQRSSPVASPACPRQPPTVMTAGRMSFRLALMLRDFQNSS